MKNVIGHSLYAVSGKLWRFSSIITITNRERKTMTAGNWTYSGTMDHKPSKREKEHRILARKAAEKGIVLLKNQGILPLSLSLPVALLGRGGEKTVKGGTGSGDVNNRENISILRALEEAGGAIKCLICISSANEEMPTDVFALSFSFSAVREMRLPLPVISKHLRKVLMSACAMAFALPNCLRIDI